MLPDNLKQQIIAILSERVQPAFILLFGSYAKNLEREDSDIDIAYFSNVSLTRYEQFMLASEISNSCNVDVDLVNLKDVDTVFANQIFSTSLLIDCADESAFFKQRMRAYSMYATLNEQRSEILDSIKERGSVYGEK